MQSRTYWRRHLAARAAAGWPGEEFSVATYAAGLARLRRTPLVTLVGFWRGAAMFRWACRNRTRPIEDWMPEIVEQYFSGCRPGGWLFEQYERSEQGPTATHTFGDTIGAFCHAQHNYRNDHPGGVHVDWWFPALAAALGLTEVGFEPAWRTGAVVGLARGIIEDDAVERFPMLVDALEDAGCNHPDLDRLRVADESLTPVDWWVWEAVYPVHPPEPPKSHGYGWFWSEYHDPNTGAGDIKDD